MKTLVRATASVLLVLASAAAAVAATAVDVETRLLGEDERDAATTKTLLLLAPDKLRMESEISGGGKTTAIFRADRESLIVIDDARKSYYELDRAALAQLTTQVSSAMKQMEAQLASLPPEQRAMVEKMMAQQGMAPAPASAPPAAKPVETRITRTDATREIGGAPATKWEATEGGEKVAEVWVASWKDAGIDEAAFVSVRRMSAFFESLVAEMASNPMVKKQLEGASLVTGLDDIDGFPVLMRRFEDGAAVEETRLVSSGPRDAPDAMFEAPAGYKKQDMTLPMGAGRP